MQGFVSSYLHIQANSKTDQKESKLGVSVW